MPSLSRRLRMKVHGIIAKCRRKVLKLRQRSLEEKKLLLADDAVPASIPLLESIFDSLDFDERLRLREVSLATLVASSSVPLRLPNLLIRSVTADRVELIAENISYLHSHILQDYSCAVSTPNSLVIETSSLYDIARDLARLLAGIDQLWLDSKVNGEFLRGVVDVFAEADSDRRFFIQQLVIVRNKDDSEIDVIARLILLCRHTLNSVRLRRVRVNKADTVRFLWNAISQCGSLLELEYEPRRVDELSRRYIVDALKDKNLNALVLSSVRDLTVGDLVDVASSCGMSDLRVRSELIHPSSLLDNEFSRTLVHLDNLLIHLDENFSLSDAKERRCLAQLLAGLNENATLEVVHSTNGEASTAAKIVSYWIHLADDENRHVKLKLENMTPSVQDSAVGRLLRKVAEVRITEWTQQSLSFRISHGLLSLLNTNVWFRCD